MMSASLSLLASAGAGLPSPPEAVIWIVGGAILWVIILAYAVSLPIFFAVEAKKRYGIAAAVASVGVLLGVLFSLLIYQDYRSDVRSYEALPQVHAAENARTSPGTIVRLAGSDREDVRLAVAANAAAPAEALDILSLDPKTDVRAAVAFNPSTPPETLESLAADRSALVRSCVGQNPAAPQHVLAALARDPDSQVRIAAVRNKSAGPEVLAAAEEFGVAAPNSLNASERDAPAPLDNETLGNVAARVAAASDQRAGGGLLEELARDPSPAVRAAAAANPSLPVRALRVLLHDPDPDVVTAAVDALDPGGDDPAGDDGDPAGQTRPE